MTKTRQGNKGWDIFDLAWFFDSNSVEKDPQYYWTISDKSLPQYGCLLELGKCSQQVCHHIAKGGK